MLKKTLKGVYIADCKDKDGNFKWHDEATNILTDTGITHIMGRGLTTGVSETADWYVGLIGSTGSDTIRNVDQMDTHQWAETTKYAEDTRPNWGQTLSAQTVGNTAAKCTYTLEVDNTTIDGAFLSSSKTAGGDSGILLSAAYFGTPKTGDSGDKLEVSYKIVGSDDTSS